MKRNEILSRMQLSIPPRSRLRVLVDTDARNEADDQYAIMHHLLTPMFDVCGIVAAHFEQKAGYSGTSMEKAFRKSAGSWPWWRWTMCPACAGVPCR